MNKFLSHDLSGQIFFSKLPLFWARDYVPAEKFSAMSYLSVIMAKVRKIFRVTIVNFTDKLEASKLLLPSRDNRVALKID